jgi:hypothetical protein
VTLGQRSDPPAPERVLERPNGGYTKPVIISAECGRGRWTIAAVRDDANPTASTPRDAPLLQLSDRRQGQRRHVGMAVFDGELVRGARPWQVSVPLE